MNLFATRQVLAALALAASSTCALAQPPEKPDGAARPQPRVPAGAPAPAALPLLPLSVDEWLAQNGGPTRLTLKMENATAEEIAEEVRKQTGLDVVASDPFGLGGRRVARGVVIPPEELEPEDLEPEVVERYSVEATGQLLEEAVRNWNRGEKRIFLSREWGRQGRWRLGSHQMDAGGERGRGVQAGPLRITATQISVSRQRSRSLSGENDPPRDFRSLSIQASMRLDPRLERQVGGVLCEVEAASDERGRPIAGNAGFSGFNRGLGDGVDISLAAPAEDARQIALLRGVVRLAVATRTEKWEVDLKATPKAQKTFETEDGPVTLHLDGVGGAGLRQSASWRVVRKAPPNARVFAERGRPRFGGNGISDFELIQRAARVFDGQGQLLGIGGASGGGGGQSPDGSVEYQVRVDIASGRRQGGARPAESAEPTRVVVEWPVAWREVQIPFELKDIPLP